MVSIIYCNIENEATQDTLKTLSLLGSEVIHVGKESSGIESLSGEYIIAQSGAKDSSLPSTILQALNGSSHEQIILATECKSTDAELQEIINRASTRKNTMLTNQEIAVTGKASQDARNVLNAIIDGGISFVSAIALPKKYIQANLLQSTGSIDSIITSLFISAVADEKEITSIHTKTLEQKQLDTTSRSELLEQIVNSFNIEDLFPEHNWTDYSEESAAASYHTLAAHFIKLQDCTRAQDCLNISDELEESPRSMALRAVISHNKGETLGAVAGLVTSLQHYEVRKRNDNNLHYLQFVPNDLEKINARLNKGLSALNHRDNDSALFHFAEAVYNFDDFYNKHGLHKLIS